MISDLPAEDVLKVVGDADFLVAVYKQDGVATGKFVGQPTTEYAYYAIRLALCLVAENEGATRGEVLQALMQEPWACNDPGRGDA